MGHSALVERVKNYNPLTDEDMLARAYHFALKAHADQKRASGEPYISHPLEVAEILTELHLDDATIAAALLHDTLEDTPATRSDINEYFTEEIGSLVDGLTKINKLNLVSKKAEQAENFRKLLISISTDIRVLIIKLADRLHNMRTLEHVKQEKRERISQETMDIYAPLAGRMGMQGMRDELEDLSFHWLHTNAYKTLTSRLDELREKNRGLIEVIQKELALKLQDNGIDAEVFSREKKPYSIWRKMDHKQLSLEQLSDIYGFRVNVKNIDDCYRVVGVAHTLWRMVPGRFKDYISNPKQNDYRSIHTTIVGPKHQRVELQIRTREMHEVAEFGIAAHALYKDSELGIAGKINVAESNAYRWLRHLVDTLLEGDNPEEFLEHTRLELFHDQVFCFTPKGRLIALPTGATPIDFAYAIHTDIGNSCVGAKVNGRTMPLRSQLKNGDEVEIICEKGKGPNPSWEQIVITGKARSAIRRATRESIRKQYYDIGELLLSQAFERAGKKYSREKIELSAHRFAQETVEDIVAGVGRGELMAQAVVQAIFPKQRDDVLVANGSQKNGEDGWFNLKKVMGLKFRFFPKQSAQETDKKEDVLTNIPIRGPQDGIPVNFSEGLAIPGDRIVGILTPGEGITIYPIHSNKLAQFDDQLDRWIDVTWDINPGEKSLFPSQIQVTALNEPGSLAKIAQIIGESDGNIDQIKMTERAADYTEMIIDLEIWDLKHLNGILNGLKKLKVVSEAHRIIQ